MKIFVLHARHLDVAAWQIQYALGRRPDLTPYGYHHAADEHHRLVYSRPSGPNWLRLLVDGISRTLTGLDFFHVLCNLPRILRERPDIIWTHTEYEWMPWLQLSRWLRLRRIPVIAQSVWLADRWPALTERQRHRILVLGADAAACTFLSPLNTAWARSVNLNPKVCWLPFGISTESFQPIPTSTEHSPAAPPNGPAEAPAIRVLSVGSDRHRDWATLSQALCGNSRFELRVASDKPLPDLTAQSATVANVDLAMLRQWYAWADVVAISLAPNWHASGLTAVLEACAMGKPVVVTDTGGLRDCLGAGALTLVPPNDATALRDAVLHLHQHPDAAALQVGVARARVAHQQLTSRGYARRHLALSKQLLDPLREHADTRPASTTLGHTAHTDF